MSELNMAEIVAAAGDVRNLDSEMWDEVAPVLGCSETNVIADLLDAVGLQDHARVLLSAHYVQLDEHKDEHAVSMHTSLEGELDPRIDPSIYA